MKQTITLLFTSFLLFSCSGRNNTKNNSQQLEQNMKITYEENVPKMFYELDISAFGCNVEVRINDFEIFTFNVNGQVATDIPINQGILESGVQTVEVIGLPVLGKTELKKDSYIRYKVVEYDLTEGEHKYLQQFEEKHSEPVSEGDKMILLKSEFPATVPYKNTSLENSVSLNEKENQDEIVEYFKYLHSLFQKRKADVLYEEMKDKFREINVALYLDDEDDKAGLNRTLSRLKKQKLELQPFPKSFQIKLSGNNKIATLLREDGSPIILYKLVDEEASFPIFICKTGNGYKIIK